MDVVMKPTDLLHHYLALHRAGDVAGLLALHTADSEFIIPGQPPLRGMAALHDLFPRRWLDVIGERQCSLS